MTTIYPSGHIYRDMNGIRVERDTGSKKHRSQLSDTYDHQLELDREMDAKLMSHSSYESEWTDE